MNTIISKIKNKKKYFAVVICLIILSVMFSVIRNSNFNKHDNTSNNIIQVQTMKPYIRTFKLYRDVIGSVQRENIEYIYSKTQGQLTSAYIKTGDEVKAEQILFQFDDSSAKAAFSNVGLASVTLDEAKSTLHNMEALYNVGAVSKSEYEAAEAVYQKALISYESAQSSYDLQLENTCITAHINGTVEMCSADVLDYVTPQQLLCVITNGNNSIVSFDVSSKIVHQLHIGGEIAVLDNQNQYSGEITKISSLADPLTGLFNVTAIVENFILPSTSATIRITTESLEKAMVVPFDSVFYEQKKAFVYLYDDGIALKTNIETGPFNESNVVITSGIAEDDIVITSWSHEIRNGAVIEDLSNNESIPEPLTKGLANSEVNIDAAN